jgi:hypothetical protein
VTASCTGGGILLGGGYSITPTTDEVYAVESAPTAAGANGTWTVIVYNAQFSSSESPTVTAYANCSK